MLEKIQTFWERLTLGRVLLGIFAGWSGITLYVVWEQRNAVFITLTGSIFAMTSIAAGIALLLVAGMAYLFVIVLERKTEREFDVMRARLGDAEDQIKWLREELTNERQDCDRRIAEIYTLIERLPGRGSAQ